MDNGYYRILNVEKGEYGDLIVLCDKHLDEMTLSLRAHSAPCIVTKIANTPNRCSVCFYEEENKRRQSKK